NAVSMKRRRILQRSDMSFLTPSELGFRSIFVTTAIEALALPTQWRRSFGRVPIMFASGGFMNVIGGGGGGTTTSTTASTSCGSAANCLLAGQTSTGGTGALSALSNPAAVAGDPPTYIPGDRDNARAVF